MQKNSSIKLGVIADDFTGASDAASFLSKSGADTLMFTSIPQNLDHDCEAIVIALKSRSASLEKAVSMTKEAVDFLNHIGCEKIYFKYCSTFDSTPKGNIGVVLDFLMEYLKQPYTLLCPSLPENGRTVKDGILYVDGVKLSDSPMKNHPLNPMWDSYIPNLMKDQSHYPCFVLTKEDMESNPLEEKIKDISLKHQKFYLIPDYENDEDGRLIAKLFKHLPLLSGGSALLEHIAGAKGSKRAVFDGQNLKGRRSIILCGSCSRATKRQIEYYRSAGGILYGVDSKELLSGKLNVNDVFEYVKNQSRTTLVYSTAIDGDMASLKRSPTFDMESNLIESMMADLSSLAIADGFKNIVVAGGETSGAVTLNLGFDGFLIGESIAPGVPVLTPLKNDDIRLILKSGNFGCDDFFLKAIGEHDVMV